MALLTDGSLPYLYDFALDGVPYLVAWESETPYVEVEPDTIIERSDSSEELSENKLDWLVWRSQRSWHGGAGQLRFDAPASDNTKFDSSYGVDVSTPGEATLLHDIVEQTITSDNNPAATRMLTAVGNTVFATSANGGTYSLKRFTLGGSVTNVTLTSGGGAVAPVGVTSDGKYAYVALGASGVDRAGAADASTTNYSSADVRAVSFEKQQLVGAGVKSGTIWRLLAIGSGAGSTELLELPDGFQVDRNAITGTNNFIYFGAWSNQICNIYLWDGTNTPRVAVRLPQGERVTALQGLLGKYVMIAAFKAVGASYKSLLYLGTPDSNGYLALTKIVEFELLPSGNSVYIPGMVERDGKLFFNWSNRQKVVGSQGGPSAVQTAGGLGVYDPEFASISKHLGALSDYYTGSVAGEIVVVDGLLVFSSASSGKVYYESATTYTTAGTIVGSIMDWNIDSEKNVLRSEYGFKSLPANSSIALAYSTDDGATASSIGSGATSGQSKADRLGVSAKSVMYQISLNNSTPFTSTPTLKKVGFGAWYGNRSRSQHVVTIKAYDRMSLKNGVDHPSAGPGLSETIYSALRTLHQNQTMVDFQPPGYGEVHSRSMKVNVRSLACKTSWEPGQGWGRLIQATLVEIPA